MDLTIIKSELQEFLDKLYNNLKEGLRQCNNTYELNELLEEEFNNLNDYKKVIKFNTIGKIKEKLMDNMYAGDAIKKALEIESKIVEIDIPHMQIDEEKIYINENNSPILDIKETKDENRIKTIIVIVCILVGAVLGWIIKRGILDVIIMGFIGAAMGYAIYEFYFGANDKKIEMLTRKDQILNKKINEDYLNIVLDERKLQIESTFLNYINEFNEISE